MTRLKGVNAVLNTLANQNSDLEPNRRSRSQFKVARLIRKLSQGLYAGLQSVLTCNCTASHNLGLEMTPRKDALLLPGDEESEAARSLDFGVVISSNAQTNSQRWDRLRVQMAGDDVVEPLPTPPTSPSADLRLRSQSPRVRWASSSFTMRSRRPPSSLSFASRTTQDTLHLSPSIQFSTLPPAVITDLCSVLYRGKGKMTAPDSYGYNCDRATKFHLFFQDCLPENMCHNAACNARRPTLQAPPFHVRGKTSCRTCIML